MTEVFATGIQMGESPRWHDGRFWMYDWLAGEVLVFDGEREVVARIDGLPFSIDWLPNGELVATTPNGVVTGVDLTPYGATGSAVQRDRRRPGWPGVGEHAGCASRRGVAARLRGGATGPGRP